MTNANLSLLEKTCLLVEEACIMASSVSTTREILNHDIKIKTARVDRKDSLFDHNYSSKRTHQSELQLRQRKILQREILHCK